MPDFGQNHENWSESGPYGSVLAHTHPFRIPYGLGCLWDASWGPWGPKGAQGAPYSCGVARRAYYTGWDCAK